MLIARKVQETILIVIVAIVGVIIYVKGLPSMVSTFLIDSPGKDLKKSAKIFSLPLSLFFLFVFVVFVFFVSSSSPLRSNQRRPLPSAGTRER